MHGIDWIIVTLPLVLLVWVGWYTQSYVKGVADFLSGGRQAGRYLLAVARGEMGSGAVMFVALFEVISKSGFVLSWWGWMSVPVGMIVATSGWVVYRFRETRALTLAQFFEVRYSKSFRIFTGILACVAGVTNFGINPAIGSLFITHLLDLPPTVHIFSMDVPTYIPLMAVQLGITLALTLSGGIISLMVTNCLEGIISQVLFLVIIFTLLATFHWSQINEILVKQPPGQSLLNPFDSFSLKDFNIWMVLMVIWSGTIYRSMAWQNQSGFGTASVTAHESRMSGIMANWRSLGDKTVITVLTVCAMTFLSHADFAAQSGSAKAEIAQIAQPQVREQMTIPIAVGHLLPEGVKGALCVVMFMGIFGGDGTHLFSWGTIFIQDVILPYRKVPFAPEQHIRLLRWAISGVAVFAFIFGCLFRQTEYVFMWWVVTETIFVGGAGVAIIGGLYWKKGTTAGAWAGLLTGSILATGGILSRQFYGNEFPLNGVQISFFGSIAAVLVYAIVSLLTCREDYNMDRLLHRGAYASEAEIKMKTLAKKPSIWGRLIGLDEHFTRGDKWLAGSLFAWSLLWFLVFVVGTIWNLITPWSMTVWSNFWCVVGIGVPIFFAVVTGIWFTWGGLRDMRDFFRRLKNEQVNALDNGMVLNHQNLDDIASKSAVAVKAK